MLRFLTAGESHGPSLVMILEGMPAGLAIDFDAITAQLRRRQSGYGRGRRMAIESDRAQALSGIRHGVTTGSPIALAIPNRDWENWQRTMAVEAAPTAETPGVDRPVVTRPRPGHADPPEGARPEEVVHRGRVRPRGPEALGGARRGPEDGRAVRRVA